MRKTFLFTVLCALSLCISSQAQWSNDAVNNLRISKEGDENQWGVIVHPTNDGKIFVSWAEWADEYNMYIKLQLLDMEGNALWEEGGIYVAKQPTPTWTGGYDMKVTPDGCAIIAHSDCRHDVEARQSFEPYAYKIDQEGNQLWGLEGLALPSMENYALRPQIGVTNAGEVLIGYNDGYGNNNSYFSIMKVNANGTLGWSQPLHYDGMMGCFAPCGENDLFLSMPYLGAVSLRCLDVYGEEVWADPLIVDDRDPNLRTEIFPIPDGKGNILMVYQRYVSTGIIFPCMQRVSPEGELLMGLTAIDINSEMTTHSRPGIALNPDREEIVAYWNKDVVDERFLLVQKFNYTGDPIWSQAIELKKNRIFGFAAANGTILDDGSIIMVYGDYEGAVSLNLIVRKLDADGNTLWTKQMGGTANMQQPESIFLEDQAIVFWCDNREDDNDTNGSGSIWGQNIYYSDGSMGVAAIEEVKASESGIIRFDGTNFNVTVANAGQLYIYNTNGALVKTVDLVAGENNVAANLAAGLYIARVAAEGDSETLKVIVK